MQPPWDAEKQGKRWP